MKIRVNVCVSVLNMDREKIWLSVNIVWKSTFVHIITILGSHCILRCCMVQATRVATEPKTGHSSLKLKITDSGHIFSSAKSSSVVQRLVVEAVGVLWLAQVVYVWVAAWVPAHPTTIPTSEITQIRLGGWYLWAGIIAVVFCFETARLCNWTSSTNMSRDAVRLKRVTQCFYLKYFITSLPPSPRWTGGWR